MKQALWDAYLAAAANQDRAEAQLDKAHRELTEAQENDIAMERYADDAYAAWEAS
jgi:hypothetical protein